MSNIKSPLRILQTDFRSGQLDRTLAMRVDSKIYASGARSLKNCLLRSTGPAERRPGMLTKAALTKRSRLIEFEFDIDEKYIFAFGEEYLRIYDADGTVVTTFSGSSDCPWTAAQVWEITKASLGDVMFVAHSAFMPRKITRTGLSTFTIATYAFDVGGGARVAQPHVKFELPATTLSISNTAIGTGRTLTASAAIFTSGWVGRRLRMFGKEIEITAYTSTTVVTAQVHQDVKKLLDPNPMRTTEGSNTIVVTHALHGMATGASVVIDGAGTVVVSGGSYQTIDGTYTITVIDEDHYSYVKASTAVAYSLDQGSVSVTIATTGATREWTEQVYSAMRGYPSAVAFHESRLYLGGSDYAANMLNGSVIGQFFNFNIGDGEDAEAIQVNLTSGRIRHIVSAGQLEIFTETREVVIETAEGEPITPGGLRQTSDTAYGIGSLRPMPFDGATLFCQSNGKAIRELIYNANGSGYVAPSVSAVSSDLVSAPRDIAVLYGSTSRPEQYAFIINSDGTAACLHSVRSEGLAAWTPLVTVSAHTLDSVCCIGTSVFFSVLRGSTYYLTRFELDATDIWLDSAKQMTATATVTWALGSAYASQTVSVMSNGHYLGDYLANGSGTITLTEAVTDIVAGFDYGIEVIPMPPDKEMIDGAMTGEIRRIVSVTVHFHETVSAGINGNEVLGFTIGDDLSEVPTQYTKKVRTRLLGYDRDPVITITQPSPGPFMVPGLSMEVSL